MESRQSTSPTISILGDITAACQLMSDITCANITPEGMATMKAYGNIGEASFQFITDPGHHEDLAPNPARRQRFTIIVFETDNTNSLHVTLHYLEELRLYNKGFKHIFVIGIDSGNERIMSQENYQDILDGYRQLNITYHEHVLGDNKSIISLQEKINTTISAEANTWYEWGNYYASQYKDTGNRVMLYKALCCLTEAYTDAPHLVRYHFVVLFDELTSKTDNPIADISDENKQVHLAITDFKNSYPSYHKKLIEIKVEQKELAIAKQQFDYALLDEAAAFLTQFLHPPFLKRLAGPRRHADDIDVILFHVKNRKITSIDGLIERLEGIDDKKRNFIRCINTIKTMMNDDGLEDTLRERLRT